MTSRRPGAPRLQVGRDGERDVTAPGPGPPRLHLIQEGGRDVTSPGPGPSTRVSKCSKKARYRFRVPALRAAWKQVMDINIIEL